MLRIGRNAHRGERCFVVASGPSTKQMDLSPLDGEIVICVNESYKVLKRNPDYICIGDYKLWPCVKEVYAQMEGTKVICGTGLDGSCGGEYLGKNIKARLNLSSERSIIQDGFHWELEDQPLHKGYNVISEVVLPFVCWAGFKDCYLVGCDCTENGYAFSDPVRGVEVQKIDCRAMKTYEVIESTPNKPTRIWNAGVGGRLEAFPRRKFEDLFRRGINPDDLLVVGYYTADRDYKQMANFMKKTVRRLGLNCEIRERASLANERLPKPMPWVLNCAWCSNFVLDMMREFPDKHILYLDADATMERRPDLFFDNPVDYDFAAPYLTNQFVQNELVSNTLFFRACRAAKELVMAWHDEQNLRLQKMIKGEYRNPYREAWDQKVLQDVLEARPDFKFIKLPWTYGKITPPSSGVELMEGVDPKEIVIMQHQASRRNKRFV